MVCLNVNKWNWDKRVVSARFYTIIFMEKKKKNTFFFLKYFFEKIQIQFISYLQGIS